MDVEDEEDEPRLVLDVVEEDEDEEAEDADTRRGCRIDGAGLERDVAGCDTLCNCAVRSVSSMSELLGRFESYMLEVVIKEICVVGERAGWSPMA